MPRKGENIYKRKDSRWEGRYICSYDAEKKRSTLIFMDELTAK